MSAPNRLDRLIRTTSAGREFISKTHAGEAQPAGIAAFWLVS